MFDGDGFLDDPVGFLLVLFHIPSGPCGIDSDSKRMESFPVIIRCINNIIESKHNLNCETVELEEYDEYDGLSPGSGLKSSFNGNRKERSGSVNVYNYITIRPDLQAMVGLKLIKYFSTILEDQSFYYTNYNFSFTSPLKFNTGAGGESAGIFIHVKHKWHRNLAQEIFYQCRFYQKGDDLYLDGLSPLPRQKASLQVSFMPFENSSVWTKITWIPETRWPEYKNIAEQSNYLYNDVVPEAINWDLALQKTIWKKRLRGSLVFRNLLNRRQISHPVGTSNLLRFYIQVELDLHPYRPDYLKN